VVADSRPAAVARLRRALDETLIGGVQTDHGFLRWLVDDEAFASGRYDTSLVAERWGSGPPAGEDAGLAALVAGEGRRTAHDVPAIGPGPRVMSGWTRCAREEALRR
jgi:acetyl/propionyl-CoA carboxylase alpha subunit